VALVLRIETLACTERCSQHSAPLVPHTIASIPCEGQVFLSDTNTQDCRFLKRKGMPKTSTRSDPADVNQKLSSTAPWALTRNRLLRKMRTLRRGV
jgi:hypothetical protein